MWAGRQRGGSDSRERRRRNRRVLTTTSTAADDARTAISHGGTSPPRNASRCTAPALTATTGLACTEVCTGAVESGENLTVNLDHRQSFRRILVFVTIYEGARSFADLHASVTLQPQYGAPVDFSLDECTVPSTVCALALITNTGNDLVVQREARYLVPERGVSPQRTIDRAYGWGMNWTPGRK